MTQEVLQETHRALANTGSAWLHLNAAALPHGRTLMDEIFGAENFLGQVVWERRTNASYLHGQFSDTLDYILVYARDRTCTPRFTIPNSESTSRTPLLQPGNPVRTLTFPAGTVELPTSHATIPAGDHSTAAATVTLVDPVTVTDGRNAHAFRMTGPFRWTQERLDGALAEAVRLRAPRVPLRINAYVKHDGRTWTTLWNRAGEMATLENAREHQKQLFAGQVFSTPKPEELLGRIIECASQPGDVVLDPFAGSGTSLAAAHKLGRQWIGVELERATIDTFVIPRLEQVIAGTEMGGITTTQNENVPSLPPAFTARSARLASQWVSTLAKDGAFGQDHDEAQRVAQMLRRASKTDVRVQQWWGGGNYLLAASDI